MDRAVLCGGCKAEELHWVGGTFFAWGGGWEVVWRSVGVRGSKIERENS